MKILDNPKDFFENFSTEEFDDLLNEFEFEYEIETIDKKYFNYIDSAIYKNTLFKKFPLNEFANKEVDDSQYMYMKKIEKNNLSKNVVDNAIKGKFKNDNLKDDRDTSKGYIIDESINDLMKAA